MASKTEQEIRDLLAATDVSMKVAERLPDAVRLATLRAQIEQLRNGLPTDVGGSKSGLWSQLSATDQEVAISQLQRAADDADAAATLVDCNDPAGLMSREGAGNVAIVILLMLTVLGLAVTLREIHQLWPEANGATASQTELQVDVDLATQHYRDAKVTAEAASKDLYDLEKSAAVAAASGPAPRDGVGPPKSLATEGTAGAAPSNVPAGSTRPGTIATQATQNGAGDHQRGAAGVAGKEHIDASPGGSAELAAVSAAPAKEQRLKDAKGQAAASQESEQRALSAVVAAQGKLVPKSGDVLKMVILMGTLGGLIHLATSLSMFVGNRALRRSWVVYYLLMPLQGAALAPIVYLLLTAAVLAPHTGGTSRGTESAVNFTSVYAFSALTGLFAKQAIEKLADVFSTIFTSVKAKDRLAT